MEFEWDDKKADSNLLKHGVRFSEAVTIWVDLFALEIPDPEHSLHEERWVRIGLSSHSKLLVVVYCEKVEGQKIRIISARKATKTETKNYESR